MSKRAGATGMVTVTAALLLTFTGGTARAADGGSVVSGAYSYLPSTVIMRAGQPVRFANVDIALHSVTSTAFVPGSSERLFDSGLKALGESGAVVGAETLAPNVAGYGFFCRLHPSMKGKLIVLE